MLTCEQPPWPNNGYVQCQSGEVLLGNTCSFRCQEGYELNGNKTITCVEGNKYDTSPPTCSCKLSVIDRI